MGDVEFSEAPASEEKFSLDTRYLKEAVQAVGTNPQLYNTEWRYLGSHETQRPIAHYLVEQMESDQNVISGEIPWTGDANSDNYLRGALTMFRALSLQAHADGSPLPEITRDVVDAHTQQVLGTQVGDTYEDRHDSIKESARRSLAGDNIALLAELNQLTNGRANQDITYGAYDVYNLFKIASEHDKGDTFFEGYLGEKRQPRVGRNEFLVHDRKAYIPEEVLRDHQERGITGIPIYRVKEPGGRTGWIITRPVDSQEDPDLVLQATRVQFSRRGRGFKKTGEPMSLFRNMDGLLLNAPNSAEDSGFYLSVDSQNKGSVRLASEMNIPVAEPSRT